MVTLSRDYFVQKVDESLNRFHAVEAFTLKAKELKLSPNAIESAEDEEMKAWSNYRLAVVSLERFDLGKMVKVDGVGYISNYSKS